MAWEYRQQSGDVYHNGNYVATGYSGIGAGRNNPDMQERSGLIEAGPIPRGNYRIGHPRRSARTGPHVLDLTPVGHNAEGRNAFQIHGDSTSHPGRASTGCIILPRAIREQISNSGDDSLQVSR